MALKAGRVGVNPRGIDKEGMPALDTSAYYNKTEADAKFATNTALAEKADQSNLTANSKDFIFAYSGGKYGYKAGSTGDFHPFEEAGVTVYGWVKPANLVRTGLNIASGCTVDDGGYAEIDGQIVIDVTFHCNAQMTTPIGAWPVPDIASGTVNVPSKEGVDASVVDDYTPTYYMQITTSGNIYTTAVEADKYYHVFGTYKKKTT